LVGFQDFDKEADANLIVAHQVQQPQARPIRERAKEQFLIKIGLFTHRAGILTHMP
jgi:hypothetical protein